ncbi:MAG TPA: sigma 54-interacting transcriptional regulator [Smithellaceae bacterium]|nr:sigma 54-interacting transcriptional regulator [Smithellaceae bacterium]
MTESRSSEITFDHLHDIFDSLTDAVIVLDNKAKYVMTNPIFCKLIGTTPENCIGKEPKELIAEGLYDHSIVYETIETGKEVVAIVRTKTGMELLSRSRIVPDSTGKVKFVVVTSTPISVLDNIKKEGRSSDITFGHLQDIFDSLTDGVIVLDRNARIVLTNPTFCKLIGSTIEHCTGKETKELIAEGLYDRSIVYETIETRKEIAAIVRTGTGVELLSRSRIVPDNEGNVKFIVVTSTPISVLSNLRVEFERQHRLSDIYLRELEHLRKLLLVDDNFIFESREMKSLLDVVKRVAPLDFTVLITGESGVGKEVLAKTIHNNSNRKNIFIPVSIPAIPDTLLESELFGYRGGAFTGSLRRGKIGLFEVAQGGTLFLDEVGDIPYPMQVKLLRTIETGEITRVGCTKPIKLDVRIIAATNRDLQTMVKKGTFREDLFYRLNVVPIKIKPLRERPEDIEPLCHYFIRNINNRYGLNKYLSVHALQELRKHNWPGNVRELRNVLERLITKSDVNCISEEDVLSVISSSLDDERLPAIESQPLSTWKEYEVFEQSKILEALKQVGGNKSKAAELLGMTRTKLYRKLKSLNS